MYSLFQLDSTCWRIEENGVRCFLMIGTSQALLIDTGFGTGDLAATVFQLTQLPVTLVNTHADGDHLGCNHQFSACYMHPAEFDRYMQKKGPQVQAPKPLWENDITDLGNRALEVILIPGHTPGSIALLDRENRVLFSGDSVQDDNIYMFGPGRNLPAYIASMEKLLKMVGSFDTIHPSHGSVALGSDVIAPLLDGAKQILHGNVQGQPIDVRGTPVTKYDIGVARFLCEVAPENA